MDESDKKPVTRNITIKTITVETSFDEPSHDEMSPRIAEDSSATLRMSGEPEPFDPYDIDKPQRESTTKTPTPESVAEDLRTATSEGVEYDEPEPEEAPAIPEPEEEIVAPTLDTAKKIKKSKVASTAFLILITIVCLAIFVIGIAMLLRSIWEGKNSAEPVGGTAPAAVRTQNPFRRIMGVWESQVEGGSCYVFAPDDAFYWLQSCEDFTDNYYYGTISKKHGNDALQDLSITLDQAREIIVPGENNLKIDNIYSLRLTPTELISEGENKTDTAAELTLLFAYFDDGTARGYRYNTGDSYSFAKRTDVKVPTRKKCGQTYYDFDNLSNNKSCSDLEQEQSPSVSE